MCARDDDVCVDHWTQATALILSVRSFLGLLFQPCPVGEKYMSLRSKIITPCISVCMQRTDWTFHWRSIN